MRMMSYGNKARWIAAACALALGTAWANFPDEPVLTWFASGEALPAVGAAMGELRSADQRGLATEDYGLEALERALAAARTGRRPEAIAAADAALTRTFVRFLSHLRFGRGGERPIGSRDRVNGGDAQFLAELREAAQHDRIEALVSRTEPPFPQYARLKRALAAYRNLATQTWPALPAPAAPRAKVEIGDRYAGVPALRDRLERLGDLAAADATAPHDLYSDEIAAGVRRFQLRHGLAADGVLGKETLAALNVPMATRVTQIVLSLERIRSVPDLPPGPLIAINIPSFQLAAFADSRDASRPVLSMPVVVGTALRTETPVFMAEMRHVEFSPYWNVPKSILTKELLPRLSRDPSYLEREEMEIVATRRGGGIFAPGDAEGIAALRSGEARLRQRPGPRNALGGVKFVLPNKMDIYLHATPATQLFARTRRDFSHGCIRVRDPLALARFVLADQPQWTAAAIEAAMASKVNQLAHLTAPIPVLVFYTTAIVDGDGRPRFLPDIYGHDRELLEALERSRLPAAHAAGVEVDELRLGIEADTAGA